MPMRTTQTRQEHNMQDIEKEAIGPIGAAAIGGTAIGGTVLGLDLLRRLRAKSQAVKLNREIIDTQHEANEMIAEELENKEAGVLKDALPQITKMLEYIKGINPMVTVPTAALGAGTAAGVAGYGAQQLLDKDKRKMAKVKEFARRRMIANAKAPSFKSREDLLGEDLISLRRDPVSQTIEEAVTPAPAPAAIEAPPVQAQLPAPEPVDVVPAVREEPEPIVEDPYAAILASAEKEAGFFSSYVDVLKGVKTKAAKDAVNRAKGSVDELKKGMPGEYRSTSQWHSEHAAQQRLKEVKKELRKQRALRALAFGGTAALPAAGLATGIGAAKLVNRREKVAADDRDVIRKIASDMLKEHVTGDTVLKQEDGKTEIQDVAEVARKKKAKENEQ
jgi:hypothetical protein